MKPFHSYEVRKGRADDARRRKKSGEAPPNADPADEAFFSKYRCSGPCGAPKSLCVCDPAWDKLTRQVLAAEEAREPWARPGRRSR